MPSHYTCHISLSSISTDARSIASVGFVRSETPGKGKPRLTSCGQAPLVRDNYHLVFARTDGETFGCLKDADDKKFMQELCVKALDKRARKHRNIKGKTKGVSLCHKVVISLPGDADPGHQMQIAKGILEKLGGDSEAVILAAIHFDTPGNPHLHLWVVDGPETLEAARARAEKRKRAKSKSDTKKTRVTRRDHLQLTDKDGYKQTRQIIAKAIDKIAVREGLRRPEIRSLAERGIDREPQVHEGPEFTQKSELTSDMQELSQSLTSQTFGAVTQNIATILSNNLDLSAYAPTDHLDVDFEIFPKRLKEFARWAVQRINERAAHERSKWPTAITLTDKPTDYLEDILIDARVRGDQMQEAVSDLVSPFPGMDANEAGLPLKMDADSILFAGATNCKSEAVVTDDDIADGPPSTECEVLVEDTVGDLVPKPSVSISEAFFINESENTSPGIEGLHDSVREEPIDPDWELCPVEIIQSSPKPAPAASAGVGGEKEPGRSGGDHGNALGGNQKTENTGTHTGSTSFTSPDRGSPVSYGINKAENTGHRLEPEPNNAKPKQPPSTPTLVAESEKRPTASEPLKGAAIEASPKTGKSFSGKAITLTTPVDAGAPATANTDKFPDWEFDDDFGSGWDDILKEEWGDDFEKSATTSSPSDKITPRSAVPISRKEPRQNLEEGIAVALRQTTRDSSTENEKSDLVRPGGRGSLEHDGPPGETTKRQPSPIEMGERTADTTCSKPGRMRMTSSIEAAIRKLRKSSPPPPPPPRNKKFGRRRRDDEREI